MDDIFWVFAGPHFYPNKGIVDFKGRFPDKEAAILAIARMSSADWFQIVKVVPGEDPEIIAEGNRDL